MKNLGRIIVIFTLLTISLFGNVVAKIEPSRVYMGDNVTYMLNITGTKIKKPIVSDICGEDITATGSQTSIESVNGDYKKSYTLTYQFTAKKSCTIKPISVEIDGKQEQSNSVELKVQPRAQDLNADFILEFKTDKKDLYVGEPFNLTLYLKQNKNAQAVDSKFIAPDFKGFWIKEEGTAQRSETSQYIVTKLVYKLAAQRTGSLSIEPAALKIATRVGSNNWGTLIPQVRWRTYYSNSVHLDIKALPNNAKLIGNFTIEAKVDKREVNPNEAVNLTITVHGEGDLEDIESFKPYLNDVNVFDEKIEVKDNTLTQKIVFVGDSDFTIQPFTLEFFNPKTKKVQQIKTEAIKIKVRGNVKKKELVITRDKSNIDNKKEPLTVTKTVVKNDKVMIAIAFVIGLFLGMLILYLRPKVFKTKTKKVDIKNEKVLLVKLLAYRDRDEEVAKIVDALEKNIYSGAKENIDKKLLKEIIKRYDIS